MKVLAFTDTKAIAGLVDDSCPEVGTQKLLDVPDGFEHAEASLWVLNGDDTAVIMKTGQDLTDAQAALDTATVARLTNIYCGPQVSPNVIGALEGATDILVQFLDKWVNGEALTQDEKDKWNAWRAKQAAHYKVTIADIPNEEDGMAALKSAARTAETDMKADEEWPA
jgi:hypothetical protein